MPTLPPPRSSQIAEAYRRWGISPASTKDIIVIKVVFPPPGSPPDTPRPTADDIWVHLSEHVRGTPVALSDDEIAPCTAWSKIAKYYKLSGAAAMKDMADPAERAREMGVIALGGMALRGL